MAKISIIVPIYNVSKYIRRCLDSVCASTLKDIEIICVDDGSTDNSCQIIKEYEKSDNRIIYTYKKNGGLVSARKHGLSMASSKYICYVDGDDYVDPNMYSELYSIAEREEVDLVTSGYMKEGMYTSYHYDNIPNGLYSAISMNIVRNRYFYCNEKQDIGVRGGLWCKLFKKNILEHVQMEMPETISHAEDKLCVLHYLLHANSVYVVNKAYYHWCINSNSMTTGVNERYLYSINEVYKYLKSLFFHKNFTEQMRIQAELYIVELLGIGINSILGFSNKYLLRIDPVWMNTIPTNSNLLFFGGGELANQYKRQLSNMRPDVHIVKDCGFELPQLSDFDGCDVAVIGIKNEGKAREVIQQLIELGIPENKILWTPQPEFFWKYAEAEGLLK